MTKKIMLIIVMILLVILITGCDGSTGTTRENYYKYFCQSKGMIYKEHLQTSWVKVPYNNFNCLDSTDNSLNYFYTNSYDFEYTVKIHPDCPIQIYIIDKR